ncbi:MULTISPECIES: tetratricopeptide repeat protein [unclassified Streptomyces]|uniref:tetratricopeptide repeat protein n=1 Tax=Streptomyces sp. NPDC127129 TaxID=3345373 RepID=UPI00363B91A2
MGAKKKSGKGRSGPAKDKRSWQGQRTANSFAGASFERSQVLGSGTQSTRINVQAYAAVPTALNALPGLPQEFTGREDEISKVLALLDPATGASAAVGSVAGLPGVGKTTLAHAVGHAALDRGWFTGVQLVNLRGYDPTPVPPQDALEALLRALGVGADHIPPTLDERAGLYRSQLDALARDGRRVLILADNASTSDQIRPLLPARHHAVLVTSRHTLPGLGARLFNLHPLQPEAAVDLLRQRLEVADPDDRRVEDEPTAAEELAALCGYLPLALQIAAALLADDPAQPLSERVRMLTDAGSRLGGLDDGERNLRAVFDECLTRLTHQQADLYRLLGLHPGPDISTAAVAALTDQPADRITPLLRQLVQARLLTQSSQARDRWSMHDLLRVHAQEEARTTMDSGRVSRRRFEQARTRLTDHYIHHARAGDTHFRPPGEAVTTLFAGREQALAWFDDERENLLATCYAQTGDHARKARLGFALGSYLEWRRRLQDLLSVRAHALEACQALGGTHNQAGAWNNLGSTLGELRRYDEALDAHQTALSLYQESGNIHGEAGAWNNLGNALGELKRYDEAVDAHQTALRLYQETGTIHGQAGAWNNLGSSLKHLRRYDEAVDAHQTALRLYQETDNIRGQAGTWNNLGSTLKHLRRYDEAADAHQTALQLYLETGDTYGRAGAWNNLGNALGKLKRHSEAIDSHQTALQLYLETGDTYGRADVWNNLGNSLGSLKRYDEAVDAHHTAVQMHQETGDVSGQAGAWNNLGNSLGSLRRYDEAVDAHQTALQLYQETGDVPGQAGALSNLGNAFGELKRHDEAADAHRTALQLCRETGDVTSQAGAWNNLGNALGDLKRHDEALDAYRTALRLCEETGDIPGQAGAWNNLGSGLVELGRHDEALDAVQTALQMHQETGDIPGQAVAWNNIGTAARGLGRYADAISAAEKAVAMLTEEADWKRVGEAWGELATTLAASGAEPSRIREAWEQSATAYTRDGDHEAAAASRASAETCLT